MKYLIILWGLFILSTPALMAEHFKAATAHWSPYAYEENGEVRGIAADILREIVKQTGDTVSFELVPAKRLHMLFEQKRIDINFADSPLWNESSKQPDYRFSQTFLTVREHVYISKKHPIQADTIQQLEGKTVGITSGYYYDKLEEAFDTGVIIKDEAPSNTSLIQKLLLGRNDAIIMDSVLFNHLTQQLSLESQQFKQTLLLSEAPLGLKFQNSKASALPKINQAIEKLIQQGIIERIVDSYTHQ